MFMLLPQMTSTYINSRLLEVVKSTADNLPVTAAGGLVITGWQAEQPLQQ